MSQTPPIPEEITAEQEKASGAENSTEKKPVKRRTRKTAAAAEENTGTDSEAPRPRRTRKKAPAAAETPAEPVQDAIPAAAAPPEAPTESPEPAKRRTARRTTRRTAAQEEEPAVTAEEQQPSAPEEAPAEKKPARRRTRKTADETSDDAGTAAPARRKRAAKKAAPTPVDEEPASPAPAGTAAAMEAPAAPSSDDIPPALPEQPGIPAADASAKEENEGSASAAFQEEEQTIHLGSALILDGILPPASGSAGDAFPARRKRDRPRPRKRNERNAPGEDSVTQEKNGAAPLAAEEAGRDSYDDGVVTNILPYPEERPGLPGGRRRNRRGGRASGDAQPQFNGPAFDPYGQDYFAGQDAQPRQFNDRKGRSGRRNRRDRQAQGYADDYGFDPAALNDSILGVALARVDDFPPEEDGPQPALPGQPTAMPQSPMDEEDFAALDAAVNGNTISAPARPGREPRQQSGRKGRKNAREDQNARADKKGAETEEKRSASTSPRGPRRVLYVSVVPNEQTEVAITEDGQLAEYFVEMAHQAKIRGNIYKGVINNIDTNLQAAFINYGNGKNGFLQIDEVHPEYYLAPHDSSHGPQYPPIQKVLKVGQELLVQVVKEPAGSKGAFLTTWISIAGRFLVLTPGQEQTGVSRKVTDHEERERLKQLMNGIQADENMGVIIRTASEGASPESIRQDLQYLKSLWADIRSRAATEKSPSLIYQEADLAARTVRDYMSEDIVEIWTDDEESRKRIEGIISLNFPDKGRDFVKLHKDQRQGLWERFGLTKQLETVTSREVILPSGGRLVFDQTEALMAVDINSGKTQGKSNFEAMVFRTNTEAAEAIARHLRLRDIGGQVVIDFIEMRDKNHCRDVERTLRNAMRRDRARHDIGHMSSFGLLELVRQRIGTSAISISCEPCPHCHGTGVRRNMEWQSLQAMRDLQAKLCKSIESGKSKKLDAKTDVPSFSYECEPELALYILNRKRERLAELEGLYGVRIEIRIK